MIRAYDDADLDDVVEVWYQASMVGHPFLTSEFFETEREQITTQLTRSAETHVYEVDDHLVGFVALVGNEVGAIFVHPDHQRRGIGHALLDHATTLRPSLELEVFEENVIGRSFYAAYGFEFVSARPEETTGHTVHRLRLS
jgi:putative acetyltransferase